MLGLTYHSSYRNHYCRSDLPQRLLQTTAVGLTYHSDYRNCCRRSIYGSGYYDPLWYVEPIIIVT